MASNKMVIRSVLFTILFPFLTSGATEIGSDTTKISLHFPFERAVIDSSYMNNRTALLLLDSIFTHAPASVDSIKITAFSSPEGSLHYNLLLAQQRAVSTKKLLQNKFPNFNSEKIIINNDCGINWEGLRLMILPDSNTPCKEPILNLLNSNLTSSIYLEQIEKVCNGKTYKYIINHYAPYLRNSIIILLTHHIAAKEVTTNTSYPEDKRNIPYPEKAAVIVDTVKPSTGYRRPLAFKTNLLFDLASALNIEVEIPLSPQWSIAGEWIFPWWLWNKKQTCFQLLSGTIEARYWLKPIYKHSAPSLGTHNPLSGWFTGVYTGAGYYDLEWKKKGYQGEFFISAGISAGYVQPLTRNLSLEYSFGIGYLKTNYRRYQALFCNLDNKWHLIRQQNGSYSWLGPAKIKISLIWYPHFIKRKGGSR